jgi:hypothetical protein
MRSKILKLVPKPTPSSRDAVLQALREVYDRAQRGELDGVSILTIDTAGKIVPYAAGVANKEALVTGLEVIKLAVINQILQDDE